MNVTRKIWPVGQGAFYTEQLQVGDKSFNVVFDCGTYGRCSGNDNDSFLKTHIDEFLRQCGNKVNLLFISHFHQDHINGIDYLLEKCKTKPLIITPSFDDDMRLYFFLTNLLKLSVGERTEETINSQQHFFFKTLSNAIQVKENTDDVDNGGRFFDDNGNIRDDLRYRRKEIKEGTNVFNGAFGIDSPSWYYIPVAYYNKGLKAFASLFADELKKEFGNDFNKISQGRIDDIDDWRKIRSCYIRAKAEYNDKRKNNVGNVQMEVLEPNNYGIMLYSGSADNQKCHISISNDCFEYCCRYHCHCPRLCDFRYVDWDLYCKTGALYTGDMLNKLAYNKLVSILFNSTDFKCLHEDGIGLLQLSHHGDGTKKNTFNQALLNNLHPHLAFCCYGSDNGYNHPGYCLLHKFRRKWDCCVFPMDENASCIEQSLGFY